MNSQVGFLSEVDTARRVVRRVVVSNDLTPEPGVTIHLG